MCPCSPCHCLMLPQLLFWPFFLVLFHVISKCCSFTRLMLLSLAVGVSASVVCLSCGCVWTVLWFSRLWFCLLLCLSRLLLLSDVVVVSVNVVVVLLWLTRPISCRVVWHYLVFHASSCFSCCSTLSFHLCLIVFHHVNIIPPVCPPGFF